MWACQINWIINYFSFDYVRSYFSFYPDYKNGLNRFWQGTILWGNKVHWLFPVILTLYRNVMLHSNVTWRTAHIKLTKIIKQTHWPPTSLINRLHCKPQYVFNCFVLFVCDSIPLSLPYPMHWVTFRLCSIIWIVIGTSKLIQNEWPVYDGRVCWRATGNKTNARRWTAQNESILAVN